MKPKPWLVITSISEPNEALRTFAAGSRAHGFEFLVIGDSKSPKQFELEGCDFWPLERQRQSELAYAQLCPTKHYARKNIGYLLAIQKGATVIRDTDDDNLPRPAFWEDRPQHLRVKRAQGQGWVNVYRWFSDAVIWPRGLPLDNVRDKLVPWDELDEGESNCPIQQGLADENPDVDAIYRLILPLPQNFRADRRVALGQDTWCPWNSQNTTWFPEAYPLLYLPAYCSFRMTDIWRSFVAQRIAWTNEWSILFHEATVWQERNEHSLMRDFADEVPGYLHNREICAALEQLNFRPGADAIAENLRLCYERLVAGGWVGGEELKLVDAWLSDLQSIE